MLNKAERGCESVSRESILTQEQDEQHVGTELGHVLIGTLSDWGGGTIFSLAVSTTSGCFTKRGSRNSICSLQLRTWAIKEAFFSKHRANKEGPIPRMECPRSSLGSTIYSSRHGQRGGRRSTHTHREENHPSIHLSVSSCAFIRSVCTGTQ